jgi:hypothetical protein
LAWQANEASKCSGCGRYRDESMNEDGPDYHATPLRCRACEALEAGGAEFARSTGASMHGLKMAVTEVH